MKITQPSYYKPTPKQKDFGTAIGREIRDMLTAASKEAPSASSLGKYYRIEDLKAAKAAIGRGEDVEFA